MSKKNILFLVIFIFLLTRVINLSSLPVFNDEAIYISWGQKMLASGNWFFSLFDGKQPLLMWIFGLFANFFPDPLSGGRLASVIFGSLSLLAIYKIMHTCFTPKTVYIPLCVYIVSPLFLFYDRQALMESALTCLGLWSLFYLVKLVSSAKLRPAIILGVLWGVGPWIKSSFVVFIFASLIILTWVKRSKLPELVAQLCLLTTISFIILLPLLLQPDFAKIISLNTRFSFTPSELFSFPVSSWWQNFISILDISFWQTLGPLALVLPLAVVKLWPKHKIIITYFILGLSAYIFTSKSANSRYLVPFLPLAIVFVSEYVFTLPRYIRLCLLGLTLVWFLSLDIPLLFSPPAYFHSLGKVSLYSQSSIYLSTFTSGYGVKPAINYLVRLVAGKPATVAVRLDAGNPEDSTFMYLSKHSNFRVTYLTPDILSAVPLVYYVARNNQLAGFDRFLTLLAEFPKPYGVSSVVIYRLSTSVPIPPPSSPPPISPSVLPLRQSR